MLAATSELTVHEKRAHALAECARLIDHFETRARRGKRRFEWLRSATLVLTVALTTLAALERVPRLIVAIVSGVTALLAATLTASRPQELWLVSRGMQQQLTAERFLFEQGAGDYADRDEAARVRLFADRVVELWNAGHARWEQGRSKAADQPLAAPSSNR